MIDGLMRDYLDPLWERAAGPLVRIGMTPNQVTGAGLGLVAISSAAYLWHRSELIFGVCLSFAFAFDALDGAVARRRDMRTKVGGYFDAMTDRYQELIVLMAIAWVSGLWAFAMVGFAGGILTSYAKARTALEIPASNHGWPDFFERMERVVFLSAMLIIDGLAALVGLPTPYILIVGLAVYALLSHFSALQRINRAFTMLKQADRGG